MTTFPLPRTATEPPWNSSTMPCVIPTYDGSGSTIHPAVHDMGDHWNGFRWWQANTPYPNRQGSVENPSIWGSNDRINWTVPAGLTNPIKPMPTTNGWFHSDTELVWDDEGQQLVCYYRLATQSTTPSTIYIEAQTSPDGVTWTDHGTLFQPPGDGPRASPAVVRVNPSLWYMWLFSNINGEAGRWSAPGPLGPWTYDGSATNLLGWHGDVIFYKGIWIAICSRGNGTFSVNSSLDGMTWQLPDTRIAVGGAGGGWDETLYRPTILASTEADHVDCWYSGYGSTVPGGSATDYVRLPDSLWPLIPDSPDPPGARRGAAAAAFL